MTSNRFKLFADYFQFVLMDENCKDDFSLVWNEESLSRMLALAETSASVGTLRNVTVNVELHLLEQDPELDLGGVDHAAIGSLSIPSGRLMVMGCTDFAPTTQRVSVAPGSYHILTTVTGVDTITIESDPANDLCSVFLWPGEPRQPRLLKHWKSGLMA